MILSFVADVGGILPIERLGAFVGFVVLVMLLSTEVVVWLSAATEFLLLWPLDAMAAASLAGGLLGFAIWARSFWACFISGFISSWHGSTVRALFQFHPNVSLVCAWLDWIFMTQQMD